MNKTFLQKRIEAQAYTRLQREYMDWRSKIVALGGLGVAIRNVKLNEIFPEYLPDIKYWNEKFSKKIMLEKKEVSISNFEEVLLERYKKLIELETTEVLQKLDNLEYLFKNQ